MSKPIALVVAVLFILVVAFTLSYFTRPGYEAREAADQACRERGYARADPDTGECVKRADEAEP